MHSLFKFLIAGVTSSILFHMIYFLHSSIIGRDMQLFKKHLMSFIFAMPLVSLIFTTGNAYYQFFNCSYICIDVYEFIRYSPKKSTNILYIILSHLHQIQQLFAVRCNQHSMLHVINVHSSSPLLCYIQVHIWFQQKMKVKCIVYRITVIQQ